MYRPSSALNSPTKTDISAFRYYGVNSVACCVVEVGAGRSKRKLQSLGDVGGRFLSRFNIRSGRSRSRRGGLKNGRISVDRIAIEARIYPIVSATSGLAERANGNRQTIKLDPLSARERAENSLDVRETRQFSASSR